jgi:hypothetical protein
MYSSIIEPESDLEKLTDKEIINELLSMKNLAISLYRNDEGTEHNEEYERFHKYLKALKKEAIRRGIYRDT